MAESSAEAKHEPGLRAAVRPFTPAIWKCWHEDLRQDSAESQQTVAQIYDVCDTYGSARWCFTRVFTRNPLRGQLSQKIITAIILSITFKLISDRRQSSQVVFTFWLQMAGENNSVAFTVMWCFPFTKTAFAVQPDSLGFRKQSQRLWRLLEKPRCSLWPDSNLLLTS